MEENKKNHEIDLNSELNLEHAEFSEEIAEVTCVSCVATIESTYYTVNDNVLCENCKEVLETGLSEKTTKSMVFKAILFGLPVALVGTAIYYAISAITGYEFGLVAILVGFMVGHAVKKGGEDKGGWLFQTIAILLTYLSISFTYVPHFTGAMEESLNKQTTESASKDVSKENPAKSTEKPQQEISGENRAISIITAVILSPAFPIFVALESPLSFLILLFGLYQAWKINQKPIFVFAGPFQLGTVVTENSEKNVNGSDEF
ncbi:MAG: hypothetical protein AAF518_27900 [Spirochaetota bacterium]